MAGPAWAGGRPGAETPTVSGEVLAVGVEDGTLFLDGDHGMEFLVVHPDAEIRDVRSRVGLPLARIRPGDLVEYATESENGMPLVRRLVVTPVGPREEPSRASTHDPPHTAQCCAGARPIPRSDDAPHATVARTAR